MGLQGQSALLGSAWEPFQGRWLSIVTQDICRVPITGQQLLWTKGNSGEDSDGTFLESNLHILRKRKLRVGRSPAGGSGRRFCGRRQRGSGQQCRRSGARGSVRLPRVRLRAPPEPLHCPARLGARPQPDPYVGSRTSSQFPPDVSRAVPFKAPPAPHSEYRSSCRQVRIHRRAPPTLACPPDVHSWYGRARRALRPRRRESELPAKRSLLPGGVGAASQRHSLET
nr:PREDICTED: uncharacterized protein LOC103565606 [Equus przewalskii]